MIHGHSVSKSILWRPRHIAVTLSFLIELLVDPAPHMRLCGDQVVNAVTESQSQEGESKFMTPHKGRVTERNKLSRRVAEQTSVRSATAGGGELSLQAVPCQAVNVNQHLSLGNFCSRSKGQQQCHLLFA